MIVYKIQRKSDGLYSKGGTTVRFAEKGKTWNARGHVTLHLTQLDKYEKQKYAGCSVVGFEIVETVVGEVPVNEWMPTKETLRAKELQEQRRLEYRKEEKQREIENLQRKLDELKGK